MTTCASEDKAKPVINALLEQRLAACVQTIPIKSSYIWEGAVQHEDEVLLLIKGKTEAFEDIRETILRLHDYDVPEIIQIPITGGHEPYLSWLENPK